MNLIPLPPDFVIESASRSVYTRKWVSISSQCFVDNTYTTEGTYLSNSSFMMACEYLPRRAAAQPCICANAQQERQCGNCAANRLSDDTWRRLDQASAISKYQVAGWLQRT